MRVYIIRHGESENNARNCWTGWVDAPLTEKGREDAKSVGALLRTVSFDRIYASDLSRAKGTAECAIPGCRYETSSLLREVDVGSLGNTSFEALTDEARSLVRAGKYDAFGGESPEQFQARILRFRSQLEQLDCQTVALFSHGGWLRVFLDEVLGIKIPKQLFLCGNCAVGIFDYIDGTWKLHSWINRT